MKQMYIIYNKYVTDETRVMPGKIKNDQSS